MYIYVYICIYIYVYIYIYIHSNTGYTANLPLSNTDASSVQSFLNFGCRMAAAMLSASHMVASKRRVMPASKASTSGPQVWMTCKGR